MEKCCISSCPKPANLACYNIPTDAKKRNRWMSNINRDKNARTVTDQDAGAVCSLHFKQNDYIYLLHDNGSSKRKISEDAVPSVFPWTCDWGSNYAAEMEIAQLSEKSSQQSGSETSSWNAGLPEGEAVQLGNVESLGITPHTVVDEDMYLGSSANCLNSLNTENTKNSCMSSIQSKSPSQNIQLSTSTSTSRVKTSENEDIKYFDILTQFYYSCTGCEFKSKDIISLKEHRVKHHPQIKSEFTDKNQSSVKSHEAGTKSSSQSLQVSRYNDKEKGVVSSSGEQGQHKSNKNGNNLHQHIRKTHSASEVSSVSDSQPDSATPASLSMTISQQPSKRSVRKWHPCSQCSFRSPNVKNLKAHVKQNHPITADTSSAQPTELAAHQKDDIATSDAAFLDISSSSLKKRLIKGRYFFSCPDTNCPFRAKDSRAVLNHCRANHPSPLASSNRQAQNMNKTTDSGQKEKYFCRSCNFSTHDEKRRKEHEQGHTEDYGYRCSICSYSVPNNRRLTYHVANHHSSDISCELCDFKAKTMAEKESHCASAHKTNTARKSSLRSAEQPSNSDCDLEHVCSQCSFKTSSRERFQAHEKTHVPSTSGSSTEELDVVGDTPRKTMKRKHEDRESSSTVQSVKLIERLIYQCPHCSFWARAVSCFHQHLIAHEKTSTFKCSHCDFSARYRVAITKHIKKSSMKTHSSACWVMAKPVSDNQYPEYLKTARVPELEYSGTSGIHILGSGEGLKRKTSSNSSEGSWKFSSESSVEDKSDEESVDWVPSASSLSSANVKDGSSSSPSSVITSDLSSENGENHSSTDTALSSDSKLKAKDKASKKSTPSTEKPSSKLMSGIVLRSSNTTKGPRRKRLRIDSDGETDQHRPLKSPKESLTKGKEKTKLDIPDPKDESNMQLQILPDCLKGAFPLLDEAIVKRDAKEQMIREAQNKINGMRTEQLKVAEADRVSQSELLKLKERKHVVMKQLMILNSEKIEAELQLRTQQCQELKLSIAMCEPEQQSELNSNVLAECKNLVAESDAKLREIKEAIANLRGESEILDSQIKESEDSHAGTAQLVEILQCELSEKETELNLLQQELAKSVSDIVQLVDKERALIVTRTAMCEEELKRLYEKGLSSIREKEKDLLSALADYIADKNDSPNMKDVESA